MFRNNKTSLVKEFLIIFLIANIITLIFLSLFVRFITLNKLSFALLTVSLTLFLLIFTSIQYRKYSGKNIIDRIIIKNGSLWKTKINIFLKLFFYGILYLIVWIIQVYIFSILGIGFNTHNPNQIIYWDKVHFEMYFYYGVMEVMMIIVFGYVINHFISSTTLIYGIIILTSIYLVIFSGLLYTPLRYKNIPSSISSNRKEKALMWINNTSHIRIFINTILFPWSSFDLFGKNIFLGLNKVKDIHWFDMSHMNEYANTTYGYFFENITWIPFVISGFYLSSALFLKRRKND